MNDIVERVQKVINSCQTVGQFISAIRYKRLAIDMYPEREKELNLMFQSNNKIMEL